MSQINHEPYAGSGRAMGKLLPAHCRWEAENSNFCQLMQPCGGLTHVGRSRRLRSGREIDKVRIKDLGAKLRSQGTELTLAVQEQLLLLNELGRQWRALEEESRPDEYKAAWESPLNQSMEKTIQDLLEDKVTVDQVEELNAQWEDQLESCEKELADLHISRKVQKVSNHTEALKQERGESAPFKPKA